MIDVDKQIQTTMEVDCVLYSKIRDKQQRIVALLTPLEWYILLFERILVWELPFVSAALIVSVHILFW